MSMTSAQFLKTLLSYEAQSTAEGSGTGRDVGYIPELIESTAGAAFDSIAGTDGPIANGTPYDRDYNPAEHTSYQAWSMIAPENDSDIESFGGLFGYAAALAGAAYAEMTKDEGTTVGQTVRKEIGDTFGSLLRPVPIYSGCSTKAMAEIMDPTREYLNQADDTASWENLKAAVEREKWATTYVELISGISGKGPAGTDTYGESSAKGMLEVGFNPCNPTFNSGAFEAWIANTVKTIFEQHIGDAFAEQNREESNTFGNELLKDLDALAGMAGIETNFGKTDADVEAENQQKRKVIAAYSRVDNIKFKEQCFLLSNVQALALIKKNLEASAPKAKPDNTAKGNASVLLQGDPFGLINKLTQNAHKEEFFEMPSAALSSLQPMIRLYKIVADEDGRNERQVEVKFDSHYSVEDAKDLLTNKANRGHGVGISSFNFSYEANNPYAIKKSIKAKLVIHANNFSELLRDRNGTVDPSKNAPYAPPGKPVPYRYIDLAMKTWDPDGATRDMNKINPQQREVVQKNMDKLTFRLKAVIGWANPSAKSTKTARNTWATATDGRITPNILDAIYDSCITLNLTPTVHTFDIDEMGRVKFTLNYLAYVEDFFDAPSFNIFTDPEVTVNQVARKVRYKKMNEECDSKEVNEIKNSEATTKEIEEEKVKNFRHLMTSMLKEKKMRFMEVPIEDLSAYRQGGPLKQIDGKLLEKFAEDMRKTHANEIVGTASTTGAVAQEINQKVDATVAAVAEEKKKTTDPTAPGDDSKAKSGSTGTTPTASEIESALNPLQTVTFFWVSDLMDVVLKNIGATLEELPDKIKAHPSFKDSSTKGDTPYTEFLKQEIIDYRRYADNFAKFRLALGPLELLDANSKGKVMKSAFVNLGDIPISAKYFMEFLTTKVLKTDRQAYPLPKFLNDFFNELVRDFLNNDTCYGNRAKQKTRVSQSSITSYKKKAPLDNITAAMGSASRLDITNYSGDQLPILDVYGERGSPVSSKDIKDETNFLIFFAARTQPTDIMRGCKGGMKHTCYDDNGVAILGDHDRGLWHYQIGKDRGIVKTIQLEKTDSPGLAEVRFEQEGYDGLAQLRVLYDAKIKTYLDVNAFPGSYIYIEPRGFDPGAVSTDLTRMGVGGYYMIIRSSHTLGAGMAETEITAKWVAEVDKHIEEKGKADEKPKQKKGKCYSGGGDRKSAAIAMPDAGIFGSLFGGSKDKDDGTTKK